MPEQKLPDYVGKYVQPYYNVEAGQFIDYQCEEETNIGTSESGHYGHESMEGHRGGSLPGAGTPRGTVLRIYIQKKAEWDSITKQEKEIRKHGKELLNKQTEAHKKFVEIQQAKYPDIHEPYNDKEVDALPKDLREHWDEQKKWGDRWYNEMFQEGGPGQPDKGHGHWTLSQLADRKIELVKQGRLEMLNALKVENPLRLKNAITFENTDMDNVETNEAIRFVDSVNANPRLTTRSLYIDRLPSSVTDGRGDCSADGNLIRVKTDDPAWVTIHEIGHALEDRDPDLVRMSNKFLDDRTEGEAPMKMIDARVQFEQRRAKEMGRIGQDEEVIRKLWSYRDNEISKPDKFRDPYCGKMYGAQIDLGPAKPEDSHRLYISDEKDHGLGRPTETISMGLQFLYQNPAKFAIEDPQHFELTMQALGRGTKTGRALIKSAGKRP